ncbi:MAG: Vitamin B12 transporter BtuB precursor [Syntrophorhabdaceae bacterium PtaU1.Bin034]|nr:MAG: Vitamin B12 transporter BtuB precursor [Syntrophorhabdaceae bacterium PtaU1.Bin034]
MAALLSLATPAWAEDPPEGREKDVSRMEEMVITATKIDKKASQVTDSVVVIDEQEITQSAVTDTTDILRYEPGIQFKRSGGPGQYVYTKLRGYGDGNFLVLIDGMKINESMSAGTGNLLSKLDPFLIGRIEVLKGPQSALYGADSLEFNWSERLFLAACCFYGGPRLRWKGDFDQAGYTRLDLTGRYRIGKEWTVYMRVNNALDHKIYEDPYLQPGAYAIAGLSWEFGSGR